MSPPVLHRAISLAALTVLEAGPIEQVRIARAAGYSHVGLRAVAATPDEPQPAMLDDHREVARVLAGEGIGVLDVEIVRLTPVIDWSLMARVVELAAMLGAGRMLVADNDPDPARSRDSLAWLAALAQGAGVAACLEFMPWTCAPDIRAARTRVAGIAGAALLVDAFHLARSGGTLADCLPDDGTISYLQLCDIAGPIPAMDTILTEARADRLFPGEGDADCAGLLRAFADRPVSLEVPADRLRLAGVGPLDRARIAREALAGLMA